MLVEQDAIITELVTQLQSKDEEIRRVNGQLDGSNRTVGVLQGQLDDKEEEFLKLRHEMNELQQLLRLLEQQILSK